jgi:hypothetical protein
LVLTARKLVRLIAVLLREGKRYLAPAERATRGEPTPPHHARPAQQRRSKRVVAVE